MRVVLVALLLDRSLRGPSVLAAREGALLRLPSAPLLARRSRPEAEALLRAWAGVEPNGWFDLDARAPHEGEGGEKIIISLPYSCVLSREFVREGAPAVPLGEALSSGWEGADGEILRAALPAMGVLS